MARRKLLKLDIACGQAKEKGWTGIDLSGDADIVHNLFSFPWPLDDNSVDEARCSHFVEHIEHDFLRTDILRAINEAASWEDFQAKAIPMLENPADGWWRFWDEVHRICRDGAEVDIIHPYVMNGRAFWDPTHVRFIHNTTWLYLDKDWREAQKLDHYPVKANFEVAVVNAQIAPDVMNRNAEYRQFASEHYWNAFGDLQVKLKARK